MKIKGKWTALHRYSELRTKKMTRKEKEEAFDLLDTYGDQWACELFQMVVDIIKEERQEESGLRDKLRKELKPQVH